MIVAGIGCRRGCPAEAIVALVRGTGAEALAAPAWKRGEPGLLRAAAALDVPLWFVDESALAAVQDRCPTRSAVVARAVGFASVAEAAVLASGGVLTRARFGGGLATCATGACANPSLSPLQEAAGETERAGRGGLTDGVCADHVVGGVQVDRYRLHYFPESGNSYKLALMLTLCGQAFEPVWTDFATRVTWTPEWRRTVNAMGEIPVLEEGGASLTQTGPILLHLAEKYGRFGGADAAEGFEVLRWLFWDNQKLSGYMATYRFLRTYAPKPDPAVLAFLRGRVNDFLGVLEERVSVRPFVIGDRATITDLSLCAYLSFPADETGYDLSSSHPHVHAWLGRIAALPGWQSPYDLLPGQRLPRYDAAAIP